MKMDKTRGKRKGRAKAGAQRLFEGLAVSPGIAIGTVHLRDRGEIRVLEYQVPLAKVTAEKARFEAAVERAKRQLGKLKGKATRFHGAAAEELGYLLDAHQHMLGSSRLLSGVEQRISEARQNAEAAVMAEITEIAQAFEQMDDPYLSARAEEVREVGMRIQRTLSDQKLTDFSALPPGSIIIAVMARSLGLPAVLGVAGLLEGVKTGETVIVDGSNGRIVVNPSESLLADYQRRRRELERADRALARLRDVPAKTRDGQRIVLQANLELPREVRQARAAGAEGIGLLRTEFLYMNRDDLPGEEEQYLALKDIIEAMNGRTVTVRTLDVGGEKLASALGGKQSATDNPALGLRAIRLSLTERKLLEPQLAAVLRAGAHGPVRILLPLITTVAEVREVRKVLNTVSRRLKRRKAKIADPLPPVGVMIEVPGAALAADSLARVADFFAIGTNDLTMYTLAIDRGEEQVAHLYNPLHPAVLRLIQFSVEAALRARIPLSVCGEMAGDPRFVALFLGLGVRELSMTVTALPRVKSRILSLDLQAATRRAGVIMDQFDSGRIAALLDDFNSLA
jgi:phosphotransferase system enzyme I (PtsI)